MILKINPKMVRHTLNILQQRVKIIVEVTVNWKSHGSSVYEYQRQFQRKFHVMKIL